MNKKDKSVILKIALALFILIWLALPPYCKSAQIGLFYSNTRLNWTKLINSNEIEEYRLHRNNAIYLAQMNKSNSALREMDRAISSYPLEASEEGLQSLYNDRAQMRLYYKDYFGALEDLVRIQNPSYTDMLKIAALYMKIGKNSKALSYCNTLFEADIKAYAGYACIAAVYANVGKYEAAIAMYDLLISRSPNRGKYYADRASYKLKAGDKNGYEEDMEKAKELSSTIDTTSSVIDDLINPKVLQLAIN